MEVSQMQRQWLDYIKSLFMEGFLDGQFLQLQQLQDENNPEFVFEVASLFFEDSVRLLNDLTFALDQKSIDFKKVDAHVHQLKGSSSSIGAQRVKNSCIAFRNFCEEQNIDACLRCQQQVKQEYCHVKRTETSLLTAVLSTSLATLICYPLGTMCRQMQLKGTPYKTVLDAISGK